MLKNPRTDPFIWFVYGGVIVTALCGILYVCVQQSFRQNLDDPQIQIAEDAAVRLCGACEEPDPKALVPQEGVNIDQSLTPWIVIYDKNGKAIVGNGWMQGYPQPPKGLFDPSTWLRSKTFNVPGTDNKIIETRVTWQPMEGVRQALVIVQAPDGRFVVAGRSMREIESRIVDVGFKVLFAWVVTIGVLFVLSCGLWFLRRE